MVTTVLLLFPLYALTSVCLKGYVALVSSMMPACTTTTLLVNFHLHTYRYMSSMTIHPNLLLWNDCKCMISVLGIRVMPIATLLTILA